MWFSSRNTMTIFPLNTKIEVQLRNKTIVSTSIIWKCSSFEKYCPFFAFYPVNPSHWNVCLKLCFGRPDLDSRSLLSSLILLTTLRLWVTILNTDISKIIIIFEEVIEAMKVTVVFQIFLLAIAGPAVLFDFQSRACQDCIVLAAVTARIAAL